MPPDEVEAKRRALTAVRPAFVLGRNASVERPFAAEFVLSETCHKARLVREQRRGAALPPNELLIAGGAHRRCTLWRTGHANAVDNRQVDSHGRSRHGGAAGR